METRINLPKINAKNLRRSFVLRQARRQVDAILEKLGEENMRFLIESDKDISSYLAPEREQAYRRQGRNYAWVNQVISDEDFLNMLPPWSLQLVASYGAKGEQWLKRQLAWVRSFMSL